MGSILKDIHSTGLGKARRAVRKHITRRAKPIVSINLNKKRKTIKEPVRRKVTKPVSKKASYTKEEKKYIKYRDSGQKHRDDIRPMKYDEKTRRYKPVKGLKYDKRLDMWR